MSGQVSGGPHVRRLQTTVRHPPAVWCMPIFLSLLWGASFFFARIAVKEVPPLMPVLLRVVIAAARVTVVSLVTMLVLVSAILLGTVFLGESLRLTELSGMALNPAKAPNP